MAENTSGPSDHPSAAQIEAYSRNQLPAAELLRVDDHLAACADCRGRLGGPAGIDSGWPALRTPAPPSHLEYEQLEAYVDGTLDETDREIVEGHLEGCAACAREAADLRGFRALLSTAPHRQHAPAPVPSLRDRWVKAFAGQRRAVPFQALGSAAAVLIVGFWVGVHPLQRQLVDTREAAQSQQRDEAVVRARLQQEKSGLTHQLGAAQASVEAHKERADRLEAQNAELEAQNRSLQARLARKTPAPAPPVVDAAPPPWAVPVADADDVTRGGSTKGAQARMIAILSRGESLHLRVDLHALPADSGRRSLEDALARRPLVTLRLAPGETPDVSLRRVRRGPGAAGAVAVARVGDGSVLGTVPDGPQQASQIAQLLDHESRWQGIKALQNPDAAAVGVELRVVPEEPSRDADGSRAGAGGLPPEGAPAAALDRPRLRPGTHFRLEARLTTTGAVPFPHLAVLMLGADGRIGQFWPVSPGDDQVRADGRWQPVGDTDLPVTGQVPAGGVVTFKAIATREAIDCRPLLDPPPAGSTSGKAAPPASRLRGVLPTVRVAPADWAAATATLEVSSEQPGRPGKKAFAPGSDTGGPAPSAGIGGAG